MKKILGIIGSPRKMGNCEIIIKEIARNISLPHELRLLRLSDFNIQPCRACYQCLFGEQRCVLDDDLEKVLSAIIDADALIVSVPTYFLGPNASIKRFLDRGIAFYASIEEYWNKPAVGIGIAGINGKEGYTLLGIESFLKLIGADIKRCTMIYGAMPGEIFYLQQNRDTAAKLAAALFSPTVDNQMPCCPICGGTTFRFLGDGRIRCMLCSNPGSLEMDEKRPVFKIEKDAHPLFLSLEDATAHREWLKSMKDRFLREKDKLKEIGLPYLKEGIWIRP